ncbi:MAG: hemolysin family protein, partial [Ruminococcus sp.]
LVFSSALSGLIVIMTPFVKIFDLLSRVFKSEDETPSVTEDELKYIIDEIEEEGVLEEQESDLVLSALQFDETTVNEILIPRVKTVGIPLGTDVEKIKEMFLTSHFSRFPVYDKTLDNIVGIITNKEFFRLIHGVYKSIDEIMQDVIYVPATKRISEILQEMKTAKTHMAVVVDQYGGTKGIVTLEDILEELVGDIYDESDEILNEFVKTAPHTYEIDGSFSISDMHSGLDDEDIPTERPDAASTSVGGWITELLGCIPDRGAKANWNRFHFTVLEADNLTVNKVRLEVEPLPENDEDERSE